MKQRIVYAVLAAIAVATPAAAGPQRLAQAIAPGVLPPYEIATIVRSAGLDPLSRPLLRGPNYVLHAIGRDDREMRVLVDARSGEIVSVTPMVTASRMPPRGVTMGPYERMPMPPPGYIPPEPPGVYQAGPPVVYEGGTPPVYGLRPPRDVPEGSMPPRGAAPPRVITATPPKGDDIASVDGPPADTGRSGMLPPPPERFPQRAPQATSKPKPAKRTVATAPKQAPLPKPRPGSGAGASPGSQQKGDAAPAIVPQVKPDAALPN